jgi:Fe2+ transport system protein FeoA
LGSESTSGTLAGLSTGQRAVVTGFADEGPLAQRLMQMGVLPGIEITAVRRAPAGDPIEFEVLGYALSLRKREAELVLIGAAD